MTVISATLSQADREEIAAAISTIQNCLPFLVDIVADERASLPRLGTKSRAFVNQAFEVANRNPDFLPRSFDVEEMRKDLELFNDLKGLSMSLAQLKGMVDDTCLLAGSEAYSAALTVYNYVKKSGVSGNGLEPIVKEMRSYFRKAPKAKGIESKDAQSTEDKAE